jgi:putative ABC transport system ATP-binding protein
MKNQKNTIVELKSVGKFFSEGSKKRHILKDVNIQFTKGEIIIILGRSGSGKSTLLNLLSGIDTPTEGQILIKNSNLTLLSEQERTLFRRKHIGFIFQFFNLIPTLNVADNLRFPLELNDIEEKNKISDLLRKIGLSDRADSFPDVLSGGEQQRVAIARALIHDPEILLADEPTGNLDFETGKIIVDLLDQLVRKQGKTMIMATHSRELIGIADRIISIKNGKLINLNPQEVL